MKTIRLSDFNMKINRYIQTIKNTSPTCTDLELVLDNTGREILADELRDILNAIPNFISKLNLSCINVVIRSSDELNTAFKGLPSALSALNLSGNGLYRLSGAGLKTAFEGLPSALSALNLSNNELRKLSSTDLKTAFEGLPSALSALNLSGNYLYSLSGDDLKTAFEGLPSALSALNLSGNGLYSLSGAGLKTAFKGLPTSLSALKLSGNYLYRLSGDDLKTALESLPTTLSALDLSWNDLALSGNDFKTALDGLPTSLSALDLSSNGLYRLSGHALKTTLQGLPMSLSTLDLSSNYLYKLSGNSLNTAFKVLPPSLRALNLSKNYLDGLSGVGLKTLFKGLPTSLCALDLSGNKLYKLSGDGLKTAFEGLPMSLNALNLSENKLQKFTTVDFSNLNHFLDKHQKFTLTVSHYEVMAMDDERYAAFKRATKNVYVDYLDEDGKSVNPKISHAEIRKAARLLAQAERATNKDESILATLPHELHCLIAAHCRDTRTHSEDAALKIAADNFNRNVFKFPTPQVDRRTPRKFLKFLSDLVDYSMKLGGDAVRAKADNAKHGDQLLNDLKEILKKMGDAAMHPTIPYRPHVYLEAALDKIDAHMRYGLAKIYGNSNTTKLTEGNFGTFKVRFCTQLNRLTESNIKQENYTAENSDQFVTDTLTAFRHWMTEGPICDAKKQLEQHRIPMTENESQCRMM